MGWFILKHIFSTILSIINITRLSNQGKDLEILILRQQLSILQRKHNSPIKPDRVEKITLAVLTARLKRTTHRSTNQLRDVIRIFQPEIILRWYRELVRRKKDQNDRTRTNTRSARDYPESREKVSARFHPILRDAIEIHHGFIF